MHTKLSPLQTSVGVHYSITDDTPVACVYARPKTVDTVAVRLIHDIPDIERERVRDACNGTGIVGLINARID